MTKAEFNEKRREIFLKLDDDSNEIIAEMKKNGTWVGGLSSDPPEIQKLKDEAFAKLRELAKKIEVVT